MAWLRAGTVAVTSGSTTVTGAGTGFAANTRVGDAFIGPDGRQYELRNVASDTVISILPAYLGPTASGQPYAVMPVQGYQKLLADLVRDWTNQYGAKMAALGSTGNYDILPIVKGGTGGADQASARAGLGLGTAATANITTSSTDGTAGRVLKVGDFGIGSTRPNFVSDVDATPQPGQYRVDNTTLNLPVRIPGVLNCYSESAGNYIQVFIPAAGIASYDSFWFRSWAQGNPSTWQQLLKSGDIEHIANANGRATKFPDGTMICWGGSSTIQTTSNQAAPSIFVGTAEILTFPVPFVTIGAVTPSVALSTNAFCWAAVGEGNNTTQCRLIGISHAANTQYYARYTAVGRWR